MKKIISPILFSSLCYLLLPSGVLAQETNDKQAAQTLEQRLARLEAQNQLLLEMLQRVEQIQAEVSELRGEIEQQGYDVDGMKKRQRNLYLDIDRRLNDLQLSGASSNGLVGPNSSSGAPQLPQAGLSQANPAQAQTGQIKQTATATNATNSNNANPAQERTDYESSFGLLREGRYMPAIDSFKKFLENHPNGRYADNAQYWLGEANYAARNFQQAVIEFKSVLQNYPTSPKVPNAKLKLGYTYYELKDWKNARDTLNDVLQNHPNSSDAALASKRLIRITEEGH